MKTLLIENNVVVNSIVATVEEAQAIYPQYICINGDDTDGGVGWTWNGTTLIPPNVTVTSEQKWELIRIQRDNLLKDSDIFVLPDFWDSYDSKKKQEWTAYRQSLRDIPQSFSNPDVVVWPIKPV